MSDEIKSVTLCFENCDAIELTIDDNVRFDIIGVCEQYYGELFTIEHGTGKYSYNHFVTMENAKMAVVRFDKAALNKKSANDFPVNVYIEDKDITHISVEMNDGTSRYISIPYIPTIRRPFAEYNLCQKERVGSETIEISFAKRNILGNLPKAAWYWSKWIIKYIKYIKTWKSA